MQKIQSFEIGKYRFAIGLSSQIILKVSECRHKKFEKYQFIFCKFYALDNLISFSTYLIVISLFDAVTRYVWKISFQFLIYIPI